MLAAGWTRLVVPYYDVEVLAEELTSYGPAVLAEEPAELREAIVRRLQAVVDTLAGTPAASGSRA